MFCIQKKIVEKIFVEKIFVEKMERQIIENNLRRKFIEDKLKLERNSFNFFNFNKIIIFFVFLLGMVDSIITRYALSTGFAKESNPLHFFGYFLFIPILFLINNRKNAKIYFYLLIGLFLRFVLVIVNNLVVLVQIFKVSSIVDLM